MKDRVTRFLPGWLKHSVKFALRDEYRRRVRERAALRSTPRFQQADVPFLGNTLRIIDSGTVGFLIDEIFEREVYRFVTDKECPYIIDCGANIGMSVIYFKHLYPESQVLAFEPDPTVFSALERNVSTFRLSDVELVNKGVWNAEQPLRFDPDPASTAGRFVAAGDAEQSVKVTPLRDYLREQVDFLKLDIEGAELIVLEDCAHLLSNVERIFVEYHSYAGKDQKIARLLEILSDAGFRVFLDSPSVIVKQPFVERTTYKAMDMVINVSGVREA